MTDSLICNASWGPRWSQGLGHRDEERAQLCDLFRRQTFEKPFLRGVVGETDCVVDERSSAVGQLGVTLLLALNPSELLQGTGTLRTVCDRGVCKRFASTARSMPTEPIAVSARRSSLVIPIRDSLASMAEAMAACASVSSIVLSNPLDLPAPEGFS